MKTRFDGPSRKARRAIKAEPPEDKAPIRIEFFDPRDISTAGSADCGQDISGLSKHLARLVERMPPAEFAAKVGGTAPMPPAPSEGKVRRRKEDHARLVDRMPPAEFAAKVGDPVPMPPTPSEGKVRRRKEGLARLVDRMPPAELAAKVGPGAVPMPPTPSEGKSRRRK